MSRMPGQRRKKPQPIPLAKKVLLREAHRHGFPGDQPMQSSSVSTKSHKPRPPTPFPNPCKEFGDESLCQPTVMPVVATSSRAGVISHPLLGKPARRGGRSQPLKPLERVRKGAVLRKDIRQADSTNVNDVSFSPGQDNSHHRLITENLAQIEKPKATVHRLMSNDKQSEYRKKKLQATLSASYMRSSFTRQAEEKNPSWYLAPYSSTGYHPHRLLTVPRFPVTRAAVTQTALVTRQPSEDTSMEERREDELEVKNRSRQVVPRQLGRLPAPTYLEHGTLMRMDFTVETLQPMQVAILQMSILQLVECLVCNQWPLHWAYGEHDTVGMPLGCVNCRESLEVMCGLLGVLYGAVYRQKYGEPLIMDRFQGMSRRIRIGEMSKTLRDDLPDGFSFLMHDSGRMMLALKLDQRVAAHYGVYMRSVVAPKWVGATDEEDPALTSTEKPRQPGQGPQGNQPAETRLTRVWPNTRVQNSSDTGKRVAKTTTAAKKTAVAKKMEVAKGDASCTVGARSTGHSFAEMYPVPAVSSMQPHLRMRISEMKRQRAVTFPVVKY